MDPGVCDWCTGRVMQASSPDGHRGGLLRGEGRAGEDQRKKHSENKWQRPAHIREDGLKTSDMKLQCDQPLIGIMHRPAKPFRTRESAGLRRTGLYRLK